MNSYTIYFTISDLTCFPASTTLSSRLNHLEFRKRSNKGNQIYLFNAAQYSLLILFVGLGGKPHYGKKGRDVGLRPSTKAETYINVVLHELIHRAGTSKHSAFARAGFLALTAGEQQQFNRPPTDKDVEAKNKANKKAGIKEKTTLDIESSLYFSSIINKYCVE